jgi:hypothetical protein
MARSKKVMDSEHAKAKAFNRKKHQNGLRPKIPPCLLTSLICATKANLMISKPRLPMRAQANLFPKAIWILRISA